MWFKFLILIFKNKTKHIPRISYHKKINPPNLNDLAAISNNYYNYFRVKKKTVVNFSFVIHYDDGRSVFTRKNVSLNFITREFSVMLIYVKSH